MLSEERETLKRVESHKTLKESIDMHDFMEHFSEVL